MSSLWQRFQEEWLAIDRLGVALDTSRIGFPDRWRASMRDRSLGALAKMRELEAGAIANPDEQRMVGHYWLRAPERAPTPALREEIERTLARIEAFAAAVHAGRVAAPGGSFTDVVVVGIGGSALGPQLAAACVGGAHDALRVSFLDNTDPDGFDRLRDHLGDALSTTLAVIISKSGGTKETRNGMLELRAMYDARGLSFGSHAVAVTGEGSELDRYAKAEGFLDRFPMWDWVGGRTSETSAVGLLPLALQGGDVRGLLAGARAMDEATREPDPDQNLAMRLALAWHHATGGTGQKDMVILPYKDRFSLLSRYLQQLVMESLGKEHDLEGKVVHQGIAVYGNKGSTDQHAYVQQLRDGVPNFFVTFLSVLEDRKASPVFVEPGVTSGDYLHGFLLGTRRALFEKGRTSITITLDRADATALGALIALYERAVGLYASLVGINAYHQPGVEAGKRAASEVLALQAAILGAIDGEPRTASELATRAGRPDEAEHVYSVLMHLSANGRVSRDGRAPGTARFSKR